MNTTTNLNNAASYAFPILKSQEIILCIEEIGIELTQQELSDPIRHREKLRTVWLALVRAEKLSLDCSLRPLFFLSFLSLMAILFFFSIVSRFTTARAKRKKP